MPSILASGLAESAVTSATPAEMHAEGLEGGYSYLLSVLCQVHDSDIMKPVMPYDNNALLSQRTRDALINGRFEEMLSLSSRTRSKGNWLKYSNHSTRQSDPTG